MTHGNNKSSAFGCDSIVLRSVYGSASLETDTASETVDTNVIFGPRMQSTENICSLDANLFENSDFNFDRKRKMKKKESSKDREKQTETDVGAGFTSRSDPSYNASHAGCGPIAESSSRWCSWDEFSEEVKCVKIGCDNELSAGGIPLWSDGDRALIDPSDGHSMVIGSTGSRKSRCFIMPQIWSLGCASEFMIISDCKGELRDQTRGFLESRGYSVFNIDLRDPLHSDCWNPLLIPYRLYKSGNPSLTVKGEMMVYDVASLIVPRSASNDPYWELSGQDLIAGSILMLFNMCDDESEINLRSVMLIVDALASCDSCLTSYIDNLPESHPVRFCLNGTIINAENTRRCILSMVRRGTRVFTSMDAIASILSYSNIDLESLYDTKTAIFLTVPDERPAFHGIVSTFVKQSYEYLINIAEGLSGRTLPRRVNLILDEFASFPCISGYEGIMTTCRSRNIRLTMVIQGLRQLNSKYGHDLASTILGNCCNIIYINSREQELLEYISRLAGDDDGRRPLVSWSQLQHLDRDKGEAVVFHDRQYPFLTSMADISLYGLPDTTSTESDESCNVRPIKTFDLHSYLALWMEMLIQGLESDTIELDSDYDDGGFDDD